MVLLMETNTSPVLPGEVQEYVHLQRQIHDALRKEHPEWVEPNGESPMRDFLRGASRGTARNVHAKGIQRQERRFSQSMTAITVRIPDESVELDNVEEHRVLTTLEVIYEGGSLHGKTADFPTRDVERVVVGLHLRNWNFFETYKRTICVDIRSQRTIFGYAGTFKPQQPAVWWKRLLTVLRIRKVKPIVI